MGFVERYLVNHPEIVVDVKRARLKTSPERYVKKQLVNSFMFALLLAFGLFAFTRSILIAVLVFIAGWYLMFKIFMLSLKGLVSKKAREIDREVLFMGRYLLMRLSGGTPLYNTLVDASKSFGVGGKYFREIVKDMETGMSIEQALDKAMRYSPSRNFRRILFQIGTALRVGVDLSRFLQSTLDDIAAQQINRIRRYGKTLSSLLLFYLLLGIVVPSIGLALMSVLGSLTKLSLDKPTLMAVLFMVVLFQFVFIVMFKASRPEINV